MADLYLKSMDIPATGNTYKIVQPDGYYPDMTAGQITTNIHDTNSVPYLFRPTPYNSTRESGDIVGASVAWNQLVRNGNFANDSLWSWWSGNFSVADNVGTVTANSSKNYYLYSASDGLFDDRCNHVLFLAFDWKTNNTQGFYVSLSSSINNNKAVTHEAGTYTADTWYTEATIVKYTGDYEVNQFRAGQVSGITAGNSFSLKNVVLVDLTVALGSTIADYINTLESGTAGAGVAKLKEWGFFDKPYYAYNAGGIESVNVSKHRMVGLNAWDEQWEAKGIMATTGENDVSAQRIRSKNQIPVFPSTSYYLQFDTTKYSTGRVACYDASGAYLGQSTGWKSVNSPSTFTTPANCYYVRFVFVQANEQYTGGICLNISYPAINGTYEPYTVNEYPLDYSLTLRGILKLDGSNNLYADGDVYKESGKVTRKYGITNLGQVNWVAQSPTDTSKHVYRASISGRKYGSNADGIGAVCGGGFTFYGNTTLSGGTNDTANKEFAFQASNEGILFRDDSITTQSAFKTAMDGVYLVYPLNTETEETADPYTEVQVCSPYGTEEFVDAGVAAGTRDVSIPVGHNTEYMKNIVYAIEGIPLPPSANGTYTLKVTVVSGVPTYSWVSG